MNSHFRYEKLLKQSRVENENEIRKRQEEIVTLKTTIKNQGLFSNAIFGMSPNLIEMSIFIHLSNRKHSLLGQAYAELKASTSEVASDIANVGAQSTGGIIGWWQISIF